MDVGQPEQVVELLGLRATRPLQPPLRVPREAGQLVAVLHDPNRDVLTPETPDDAQTSIITADDQGTGVVHRESRRVSSRAAKPLPATKRMSGPKLHAAGAPTMCRPGTDVSKPAANRG